MATKESVNLQGSILEEGRQALIHLDQLAKGLELNPVEAGLLYPDAAYMTQIGGIRDDLGVLVDTGFAALDAQKDELTNAIKERALKAFDRWDVIKTSLGASPIANRVSNNPKVKALADQVSAAEWSRINETDLSEFEQFIKGLEAFTAA